MIAMVGSLGHQFHITAVLPTTTIGLLIHVAFAPRRSPSTLGFGLVIAVVLGYLEDLHQGGPTGITSLAFGGAYIALYASSLRLSLTSWQSRLVVGFMFALGVDLLAGLGLLVLAEPLGLSRGAVMSGMKLVPWRALETALLVHPIWSMVEGCRGWVARARGRTPHRLRGTTEGAWARGSVRDVE